MPAAPVPLDAGSRSTTPTGSKTGGSGQLAGEKMLEQIMKVEVVTPADYVGDVIGDLNARRGQIQGTDLRGDSVVINAFVPLAQMSGYVSTLRGMTQGRALFHMERHDE